MFCLAARFGTFFMCWGSDTSYFETPICPPFCSPCYLKYLTSYNASYPVTCYHALFNKINYDENGKLLYFYDLNTIISVYYSRYFLGVSILFGALIY